MKIDNNCIAIQKNIIRPLAHSSNNIKELSNKEKAREIKIRKTCKDLESIFITQMFKAMEKTIPKNSLVGSKNTLASMMFSSVMGEAIAKQGGIGLADIIYESLKDKEEIPKLDELNTDIFLEGVQSLKLLNNSENK